MNYQQPPPGFAVSSGPSLNQVTQYAGQHSQPIITSNALPIPLNQLQQPHYSGGQQPQQWNSQIGALYSDTVGFPQQQQQNHDVRGERNNQSGRSRNKSRTPERDRSFRNGRRRSRSSSRSARGRRRRRSTSESSRSDSRDRSYSRSRSRDRDYRSRDSGEDRDYRDSRSDYRDRGDYDTRRKRGGRSSPTYSRRRDPESVVCSKVMLPSLPSYADRDTVNILIARQGFHPIDIRIVRRSTDTGARVFGFVEFSDVKQAQSWIEYNQGYLRFDDGYQVRMEYSREKEGDNERRIGAGSGQPLTDWTCAKCTINNFNRRTNCFKCGTSRNESEELEAKGYAMVGVSPCDTILVRELPMSANEECVRLAFVQRLQPHMIIQRVYIAPSRRYALIQMRSAEEASYMLNAVNRNVMTIDNCTVIITFARQSLNQILILENVNLIKSQAGISSSNIHEDPTNSAAQLAQNAIRIAQMSRQPGSALKLDAPIPQSISTPFGYLPSYPTPNPKDFQLEPNSGYHYDSQTGFYHDIKTNYYYNSATNAWMFWCSRYSTYINCEGGDQELKKKLQEEEISEQVRSSSAVITAPPVMASYEANKNEKANELNEELWKVNKELDDQNSLLERTIRERSKGIIIPADCLESIISRIKKLEEARTHLEMKKKSTESRNIGAVFQASDDDDIEFICETPVLTSKQKKKNYTSVIKRRRSRSRQRNKSRKTKKFDDKRKKGRHRSLSKSPEIVNTRNSRNRRHDSPMEISPNRFPSPPNKSSFLPSGSTIKAAITNFAPALTVRPIRQNMNSPPQLIQAGILPVNLSTFPQNIINPLMQKDSPRRFPDNDNHWATISHPLHNQTVANNFLSLYPSKPTSIIPNSSAMVLPPATIVSPIISTLQTAEEKQLRLIQQLAVLDQEQEKLEKKEKIFKNKFAQNEPLIKAAESKSGEVQRHSLDDQKRAKKDLLTRALNATRKRMLEQARNFEVQRKQTQLLQDQDIMRQLNLCINCALFGHTEMNCTRPAVSQKERLHAIKRAKEKKFQDETEKIHFKNKARQYRVVRKDPFLDRLRCAVPDGFIHQENIVLFCGRCANFGHAEYSIPPCRAPAVSRHLSTQIGNKLVEFARIFFFHLNEDNLVDFSKKFDLFNTMDAIESGGYLDPIGLQLQTRPEPLELVPEVEHNKSTNNGDEKEKKRKHKAYEAREDRKDSNASKTPQEIQREMDKWARRQERIKMTLKMPDSDKELEKTGQLKSRDGKRTTQEPIQSKPPWCTGDSDDDDEAMVQTGSLPKDAVMPGKMRNVGLPLNAQRESDGASLRHHESQSHASESERAPDDDQPQFDEQSFIDTSRKSCLLCRRQFPNIETLEKHVQMSQLHKTNVEEKVRELQKAAAMDDSPAAPQYRDRAKERRNLHGLDPGLVREYDRDYRDRERHARRGEPSREAEIAAVRHAAVPLDESNIGNRLLKSMGWTEGKGLGRNEQGIVNPIQAEKHTEGVGLGAAGARNLSNLSNRERNRIQTMERFKQLND